MSHRIHKAKTDPANFGGLVDINLVGLAIGNGWMSPLEQGKYASYLYYHGLLDGDQYLALMELEDILIQKVSLFLISRNFCLYLCTHSGSEYLKKSRPKNS